MPCFDYLIIFFIIMVMVVIFLHPKRHSGETKDEVEGDGATGIPLSPPPPPPSPLTSQAGTMVAVHLFVFLSLPFSFLLAALEEGKAFGSRCALVTPNESDNLIYASLFVS